MTISNGITSSTRIKTGFITVTSALQVHLGNDTSICAKNTIILDAGNPGADYLWSTGATTRSIVADSAGTGYGSHQYWVHVAVGPGCSGQDTIQVTFDDCTGIAKQEIPSSVRVFPNPAGDHFMLDICGFEGGRWELSSMTGFIIGQSSIETAQYNATFDVRTIPRGIYILKVQKENAILIKKVIISPIPGN